MRMSYASHTIAPSVRFSFLSKAVGYITLAVGFLTLAVGYPREDVMKF